MLARTGSPWRLELLDARDAPAPDAAGAVDLRQDRLRRLVAVKTAFAEEVQLDGRRTFVHLEPVRIPAPTRLAPEGTRVIGAIEISRDLAYVDAEVGRETLRLLGSMALLLAIIGVATSLLARRTVARPMEQLLAGIDDVTKGDLSRVLLQERDDEIGRLAARFNDMTGSLREARAETRANLDQLRRSEKLATIGRLAAEIAHEIGTPLNVVTGRARTMAKKADDREAVQKNATIIAEQAARITRIIQRLLDFARRGAGEAELGPVDLNRLAREAIELLEHQLGDARIELRLALDEGLPHVLGNRDQIQQVLLNLYVNAIQAMPSGGVLSVRTSRVVRRRPGLEVAPEQPYAVVTVSDTGQGIPEEARDKIFEAFYTSKGDRGGTGLGLAVAHGIVKDHDGWIELESPAPAGRGTVFRIHLPLGEAQPAAERIRRPAAAGP